MGQDSIFSLIIEFFRELVKSLGDGYLFFGGPLDIIRYVIDIALVTLLFYWIMVFLRQTRAWQLVKGIVLILMFVALMSIIGLQMVGFLFNRLLYVFAFFFIILFQPEFRRVLETVGLRTTGDLKEIIGANNNKDEDKVLSSLVHEVCYACKEMCKTYTGALILIERNTKLDELLTQENVVKFDSTVTNSVLQSIFYKGSPMHDGGLLIRDGRIVAARCHVPLSVTMHALERAGTRHRAAVGASEMGDTIAVVVSEERGKTSIAVNGMLFEMADEKELEANLSYLLGVGEYEHEKRGLVKVISKFRKHRNIKVRQAPANVEAVGDINTTVPATSENTTSVSQSINASKHETVTEAAGIEPVRISLKTKIAEEVSNSRKISNSERAVFILLSFLCSLILWMYIQVNNNPVVTKTITVPISYSFVDTPDNVDVSYPIDSVELTIVGRRNTISNLSASDIVVSIDYSTVTADMTGVVELPVTVTPKDNGIYFRVEQQLPETVSVTVYSVR